MLTQVTIAEMPKSHEEPQLSRAAALLMIEELGYEYELEPDAQELQIERVLRQMDGRTTVAAYDDDETVLAVGGLVLDGHHGEIVEIATSPDHRRRGLGRNVVGMIEAIAMDEGVKKLSLLSVRAARPFYEELGYQYNGRYGLLTSYFKLLQLAPAEFIR